MFADVFSSICYIQIMPNVNSEIENQKRSIERLRAELTSLYRELGEVACSWHEAINYEPSNEAYSKLVVLQQEEADVEGRIDTLKTAVSDMSAGDRQIEQTKVTMKELDKRYAVLISSLGAVAIYKKEHTDIIVAILISLQHMVKDREARSSGGHSSGGSSSS